MSGNGTRTSIIEVDGVSKKFCRNLHRSLIYAAADIAGEVAGRSGHDVRLRNKEFWALKDVSFRLARGETLGLVGRNGSGKTTLLRIISGVLKPSEGSVTVLGSIAPLLATGSAGFSNILSGRENALITMAVLGLSKRAAADRMSWLVDFSELGEAINAPLRTYSSGMRARLWFASAVAVQPDVLILDEVLAVGDFRFRAKCREHLTRMKAGGTAFIFVSHDTHAITSFCDRAVLLRRGVVTQVGPPRVVMRTYEEEVVAEHPLAASNGLFVIPEKSDAESTGIDLTRVELTGTNAGARAGVRTGEPWALRIDGTCRRDVGPIGFTITVGSLGGGVEGRMFTMNSELEGRDYRVERGPFSLKIACGPCVLMPGAYEISITVHSGVRQFDEAVNLPFAVESDDVLRKSDMMHQPRNWPAALEHQTSTTVVG